MEIKQFENVLVIMDSVKNIVEIINCNLEDIEDVESFISDVGYDLENVEWMYRDKVTLKY